MYEGRKREYQVRSGCGECFSGLYQQQREVGTSGRCTCNGKACRGTCRGGLVSGELR